MLLALVSTLHIAWWGIGAPVHTGTQAPVIIARPPQGRVPMIPGLQLTLRAFDGRTAVPAEWSVSPQEAVTFSPWMSSLSDTPGTSVQMTAYRGPATVRATYGSQTATTPAFVYDSVAATCYLGYPNGVRFDGNGAAKPSATPQESDVFTLGPQNQPRMDIFFGCTGAFAVAARSFSLHFPYGATVIRRSSGIYFGNIRVSDWRNDFTVAPPLQDGDAVIFRLRDGRTAKVLVDAPAPGTFGGVYLTGPPRGDFYDYVFFHNVKPTPHALFGTHE